MFVAGFLRLLLYLALAYAILSIVKGIASSFRSGPARPPRSGPPDALVKDDVCGTYLPRRDALRAVIDGRERFFCSAECRDKARAGGGPSQ
jgi:YHS domain-containing protein